MNQYIVSARKYRPVRFEDVIGQEQVTDTLRKALKSGQLAQSFLFCGPRGVGKTTCARILAKAINCEHPDENFEPCNTCNSCAAFNENASFNIHELDAASNNSVDDIRYLVDQVRFAPQSGKYKVYIIDEVHMLSAAAFNAFLKTLEEPPSYAVFILATTEKHKIIPTILSRCQIYDFKRISNSDIVKNLKDIADKEGVQAEEQALHTIAQKSDGGMRDALSLFDKIASYSGKTLAYNDVINNLNILDYDYYFKFSDYLLLEDSTAVLQTFNEILDRGFDGEIFLIGISEHFRQLLVSKDPQSLNLLEASEDLRTRYQEQASKFNENFLLNALNIANQCDIQYKTARNKRLHVELALLKICFLNTQLENVSGVFTVQKKNFEPSVNSEPNTASQTETTISILPKVEEKPIVLDDEEQLTVNEPPSKPIQTEEKQVSTHHEKKETVKTENSTKPSVSKTLTGGSFLQSILSSNQNKEEVVAQKETPSQTLVEKTWRAFLNGYHEQKESLFMSYATTAQPIWRTPNIVFEVKSNIAEGIFRNNKRFILTFFKERLEGKDMDLLIENIAVEDKRFQQNQAATVVERLIEIKESNPYVKVLIDKLNLEDFSDE
ncbi:MAG: DNA polymerase III subunit gamma/tau [Chitinophagales bacterium]|nr:DNA polymerase III subunit gamma/tau [Chitinophagales bacterium]